MRSLPCQTRLLRIVACLLASLTATQAVRADVTLPAIFSDHMVLQRSDKVPVWGWAAPGEQVAVLIDKQRQNTQAGPDGRWQVVFDLTNGGSGAHVMEVQGSNHVTVKDVLIGEVWLCSGQSNMGFLLHGSINDAAEIAASANDLIREFHVDKVPALQPSDKVGGSWRVAGPATSGSFSAVGWFFAKTLQKKLGQSVGIIHVSYGGTPIETWMSQAALDADPDLGPSAREKLAALEKYPAQKQDYETKLQGWEAKYAREDIPKEDPAAFATASTGGWQAVSLPGILDQGKIGGAVWLRRDINISDAEAGKSWPLYLGIPDQLETVYWNGQKIGEMTTHLLRGPGMPRSYSVPANLVVKGVNVLAVRLHGPAGPMGILGSPVQLRLSTVGTLTGEWFAKTEYDFPPLPENALAAMPPPPSYVPEPQGVATTLFNGAINPLIPFAIRGVAWYQGEGNGSRAWQYRKAFPLLIQDWRKKWGEGDFPFCFCQIANMGEKSAQPGESDTAELREAQGTVLALPNTGEAVLVDLGEVDVHFRDKSVAGARLAQVAMRVAYQGTEPFSGPMYQSMQRDGSTIRLSFTHADGGLMAKPLSATYTVRSLTGETKPLALPQPGSPLQGFAICGTDRKWTWADAHIDGDAVLVSSPQVPDPVAVRYAWAANPTCNLYNGTGLPASPFRTDDFPATTVREKY